MISTRRLFLGISPGIAVIICFLLMTFAIGTSVLFFARAQDGERIAAEQQIVRSAINDAMAKLGDALRPNTYWDDGYDHLTDSVDAGWAQKNLGPYARDTSGVSILLVLSKEGRAFYRFAQNPPKGADPHFEHDPAIQALARKALSKTTAPPVIATGFVRLGNRTYLAAASQLVPNDERANRPLRYHNVEIYLHAFDGARISKVERDFQISKVSLSIDPPPDGMASVHLTDAAGDDIGYLWWRPATPGTSLAGAIAPLALFIILTIGMLLWAALRSWASTLGDLERKELEAQALRQEVRGKAAFIGNISHELRTPLNAILGFSDLFVRETFGPLGSAKYREYAKGIHSSGDVLLQRINDIIELASIESHEKPLVVAPVSPLVLVQDAVKALEGAAVGKNISLQIFSGGQLPLSVTSSAAVREILVRVLDNAIKFSEPGGAIEIFLERHIGNVIQIRDHGIGMAPELLALLGKPFEQAEGHLKRKHGGLGLGLAISRGLARLLDITIEIESGLGEGTKVTQILPDSPPAGHGFPNPAAAAGKPRQSADLLPA